MLIGAGFIAVAATGLTIRFSDVLEATELMALTGAGGLALIAGLVVARVQLHSLSIAGIGITLPVWTAQAMRRAIDEAITARGDVADPSRRRVAP